MSKRASSLSGASPSKRHRGSPPFNPRKIADADNAAAADEQPPMKKLVDAPCTKTPRTGESVVYWMRMGDLRVVDNKALSLASRQAVEDGLPLIAMFVFSPQDYLAHDRGARRIDFTIRNLVQVRQTLAQLHIPLYTVTQDARKEVPNEVIRNLDDLSATALYANIEYEVDELRRDIRICELAKSKNIATKFVHDKCVIEPGLVLTKDKRTYSVYTPYQKLWLNVLNEDVTRFLHQRQDPQPNAESIRSSSKFGPLFDRELPSSIPGFELDEADANKMAEVWPSGETAAREILQRFMQSKARTSQLSAVDPLADGAEASEKQNRLAKYDKERDRADLDTTSRISPYLAAGVISARACIRATLSANRDAYKPLKDGVKVDGGKTTAIGRWVQEVAWRDFYVCILAGFPRGRNWRGAYSPKGKVPNEKEMAKAEENIEKWKKGQTGVPIVDAGMRCLNEMGWLHNRLRMICAMFLTKDLMVDWRVGEKYFMENLIDGDLASNNGGWQWSASTGVDPCPYFRIFNPFSQSEKADPTGDFIRKHVPELAKLKGPDLHKPSAATASKLGYPQAIVKHDEARQRALRRFKNPGTA
ncbi:Deoxyribodipyrimidine photo-lyase [Mycena kentingensis (nom. inval.)]|nr:Deoxyribodipyrimidine photo-lyase [Mycena kentingensis (nom. inval.)]